MSGEFQARNVVITGASAGVGRAVAFRFARAGACIGLIARDADALNEVKSEVEKVGGSAVVAPADVSNPEEVFAAAAAVVRQFGSIDVWINDAMVTVFSPVWDITPAEFRRVTEVTYLGAVHGTMAALRHMRPRNRGTIVQVGSALAYRGIPLQAAYCGAKHAIRGFTDSLRAELLHSNSRIKLTTVELPAVNTPQFDWARTHMAHQPRPVTPVVQPEPIADAIFSATLHPAREYWVGWTTFKVILGNMLLPGVLDYYLARTTFTGQETCVPVARDRKDNLMEPVHDLHRTRGRFGQEAGERALVVAGPLARAASAVACGAALLAVGLLGSRSASARRSVTGRRRVPVVRIRPKLRRRR
jgi:NAD(P)-dependent dehydrogenase (short-subunit alcohol dehydrogenase family)